MAFLCRKQKLYGIPDAFAGVPQDQRQAAIRSACDSLVEKQIATTDFDSQITLDPDYLKLVDMCCDCERCAAITSQKKDGTASSKLFWRKRDEFLMAEATGTAYVFSKVLQEDVAKYWPTYQPTEKLGVEVRETAIPSVSLTKAKRAVLNGDDDAASRALRENGAGPSLTTILVDGLKETADYLGVLLVSTSGTESTTEERAWLSGHGAILEIGKTVINFRTCITFKQTHGAKVVDEYAAMLRTFVAE
jgi:hypothetical protein